MDKNKEFERVRRSVLHDLKALSGEWDEQKREEAEIISKRWHADVKTLRFLSRNLMTPLGPEGREKFKQKLDDIVSYYIQGLARPLKRMPNGSIDAIYESKKMKKNVKRINETQLRTIVAEATKKVLMEGLYVYPHNYMEPLIGKELAQIEDAIDVISAKLTTHKEPNTIGDPVGKLRQDNMGDERIYRRIQKAIKDIKYGVDDLRNCLNPDIGEGEGQY